VRRLSLFGAIVSKRWPSLTVDPQTCTRMQKSEAQHGHTRAAEPLLRHPMIIECEFTNASDFARERVTLLTGMRLLIDHAGLLYAVSWDESKNQPDASIAKLNRAMHDSEFRIHLDREGYFITLARCLGARWTIWFIGVDWRPRNKLYSRLLLLQRAMRSRVMRWRLARDQPFSKAAAATEALTELYGLNGDLVELIVHGYYLPRRSHAKTTRLTQPLPDGPFRWIKPERDGQIFA
jgi:hypothetical protein